MFSPGRSRIPALCAALLLLWGWNGARAATESPIRADQTLITLPMLAGYDEILHAEVQLSADAPTAWTASTKFSWLTIEAESGTTPSTLKLSVDTSKATESTAVVVIATPEVSAPPLYIYVNARAHALNCSRFVADPAASKVYALSTSSTSGDITWLVELDSATQRLERVLYLGQYVSDVAYHPGDHRIYVAENHAAKLVAIDPTTFQPVAQWAFTPEDDYDADGTDVYELSPGKAGRLLVKGWRWPKVNLFDTGGGQVLQALPVSADSCRATADGLTCYVVEYAAESGETMRKYDLSADTFAGPIASYADAGWSWGSVLAISPDGERVTWNGRLLDAKLNFIGYVYEAVYSFSAASHLAFGSGSVFDVRTGDFVMRLGDTGESNAFSSRTSRLVFQDPGDALQFIEVPGETAGLAAPVLTAGASEGHDVHVSWTLEPTALAVTLVWREVGTSYWQTAISSYAPPPGNAGLIYAGYGKTVEVRIHAERGGAYSAWSNVVTMTTRPAVKPAAVTLPATDVTSTSAVLHGTFNAHGRLTAAYFSLGDRWAAGFSDVEGDVPTSKLVTELQPGHTYTFRVAAYGEDSAYGEELSFTTLAAPPAVTINEAGQTTRTTARLSGTVDTKGSGTNASFDLSLQADFASPVRVGYQYYPGGDSPSPFACTVSELLPDHVYYFRLRADNGVGETLSQIGSFRTAPSGLVLGDDLGFVSPGQAQKIAVLANDTSIAGDPIQLTAVGKPAAGTAVLNGDGTITYTPGRKFAGTDSFSYTVADTHSGTATAMVTTQSAGVAAAGRYRGLIEPPAGNFATTGAIDLTVTRGGQVTGRLAFAGAAYPLSGRIGGDGAVSLQRQIAVPVSMRVDPRTRIVSGEVVAGLSTLAFTGSRDPYDAAHPAPQAGRHTFVFWPARTVLDGYGFATMVVDAAGGIRASGRTPAGAPFSTSSRMSDDARFGLYFAVNQPSRTSLHGWQKFEAFAGISDFSGLVRWEPTAGAGAEDGPLIGSRYQVPARGTAVLPFPSKTRNAVLVLYGADGRPNTMPLTLTAAGLTAVDPTLSNLHVDRGTGLFSGKANLPGRSFPFSGVIHQAQNLGAGVAMRGAETHSVVLAQPAADPSAAHRPPAPR